MIKLLLTSALLAALLYAWTQHSLARLVRAALYSVIFVGILFVWDPELTNDIAHFAGIGRGADLVFYVWIVLSFIAILNLHLKLKQSHVLLTDLARYIALAEAHAKSSGALATDARRPGPERPPKAE